MKFDRLYSSSTSNLYLVTAANGKRMLIECGVTWPKLQKALNYDLTGIEACLLSHEHKDHSKSVIDVMGAGITLYSSAGTLTSLGIEKHRKVVTIADKVLIMSTSFDVVGFKTTHDAAEPLGFIVHERATHEFLLFATDTSHITQEFKIYRKRRKIRTSFNIIAIECSYDINILRHREETKDINSELAKRLLSSHMEKQRAMDYIEKFCDLSACRAIHLLHMSGDNIDKEQTKIDFEKRFFIETHIGKESNVKSGIPGIC